MDEMNEIKKEIAELKIMCKVFEAKMDMIDPPALITFQGKVVDTIELLGYRLEKIETKFYNFLEVDCPNLKIEMSTIKTKFTVYVIVVAFVLTTLVNNLGGIIKFFAGN